MVHPLRNILDKLRWKSTGEPDSYLITYRHRGAPDDVKKIRVTDIRTLGKSHFTLASESGEDVVIPFHRILEIHNTKDGSLIWESRKKT